jgi:anti-sigma factor ChrR (cupin superfamily)
MTTNRDCFCDLAPLYVLDLLNEDERNWVEAQVATDADLAAELAELQLAATAIPYGLPAPPIAENLQARLFDQLGLPPLEPQEFEQPVPQRLDSELPFGVIRAQDMLWQPQGAPGIEIALLRTDQVKREMVGVLRAGPGARYPLHRHAGFEELYMLSGDLRDGEIIYGPGDYIRSQPGTAHAPYTEGGCMFFFHSSMDDEYLELETSAVGG